MFKEPVEILPNVNYTACATLKVPAPGGARETGGGNYIGRKGAKAGKGLNYTDVLVAPIALCGSAPGPGLWF